MGLTGEPVADGSRSGAITHRNEAVRLLAVRHQLLEPQLGQ